MTTQTQTKNQKILSDLYRTAAIKHANATTLAVIKALASKK